MTARRINLSHFVTIHSRRTDGPVILSHYTILTSAILSQYTRVGQTDERHVSSFFSQYAILASAILSQYTCIGQNAKRLWTWLQSFCHNTHTNDLIQFTILTSAILSQHTRIGQTDQSFCRNTRSYLQPFWHNTLASERRRVSSFFRITRSYLQTSCHNTLASDRLHYDCEPDFSHFVTIRTQMV